MGIKPILKGNLSLYRHGAFLLHYDNFSEPMRFRNTEAQEVAKIASDERYLTTLLS